MATTVVSHKAEAAVKPRHRVRDLCSFTIDENLIEAIDGVRGDTNRSLWIRRLIVKELTRLHKLDEPDKKKIAAAVEEAAVSH